MFTITCYQCPVCLDVTTLDRAIDQAEKHGEAFAHNVGVYNTRNGDLKGNGECVAIVLKWQHRAA